MKKIFLFLFISISFFSNAQSVFVSQIIDQVNIDSLMLTVRQLSGDTTVIINNQIDSITSRFAGFYDSVEIEKAATFIEQKFKSFGLKPIEQPFNNYNGYTGKNIYAYQQGTDESTNAYIVCAHYDNLPGARNYGADDNGSGVSAVIEAARLLSKHPLPYSIYYILFDHEEQGLIGSEYYANFHDNADTPVLGVINMDMIAYDGNNDSIANIHIRPVGGDSKISNKIILTDSIYQIGINLKVYTNDFGKLNSDHASFWQYFMPAVLFIEDDMTGDFNPNYHTIYDRINLFNTSYYHRMVKLAIATLVGFAADSSHVGMNEISEQQNSIILYPNPVDHVVKIDHINGSIFLVKITSMNGQTIFEKEIKVDNKTLTIQLPENTSQGLYQISLINAEGILFKRFLKQ